MIGPGIAWESVTEPEVSVYEEPEEEIEEIPLPPTQPIALTDGEKRAEIARLGAQWAALYHSGSTEAAAPIMVEIEALRASLVDDSEDTLIPIPDDEDVPEPAARVKAIIKSDRAATRPRNKPKAFAPSARTTKRVSNVAPVSDVDRPRAGRPDRPVKRSR